MKHGTILISRTDSIGDVVLTLPVAAALKQRYPELEVLFLGRDYTRAVVMSSEHIDRFISWDEIIALPESQRTDALKAWGVGLIIHVFPRKEIALLARKAGIPQRMGTTNRWYHWISCNRLVRLSRKGSSLHEAQLNLRLIRSLNDGRQYTKEETGKMYGLTRIPALKDELAGLTKNDKFNLIIHPRSKGSAREWGFENFRELIRTLPGERFRIFITGTEEEGLEIKGSGLSSEPGVTDLTGQLTLDDLMAFIAACDGLVAASTGPLHLAAAMGKVAVGIYPPIRPMNPGRWAPLGKNASYLVIEKKCIKCKKDLDCECIRSISADEVCKRLTVHL